MIRLSRRLNGIYEWIDGEVIADIGCDHGYIPFMVTRQHHKKAYACDVAEKPLERARRFFEENGVKIDCLLMDGIQGLPKDVDQIVIAGMGGQLICSILQAGKEDLEYVKSMILSPHKNEKELRLYLMEHGFTIVKERIVQEDDHFYPILYVGKGTHSLSREEILYGRNVVNDRDYRSYLREQIKKWSTLQEKVPALQFVEGRQRLAILQERIRKAEAM